MGGVCDGSDPTDPVECGNSQHSPPTSLDHDIGSVVVSRAAIGGWFSRTSTHSGSMAGSRMSRMQVFSWRAI